jgi:hypothetical protein
MFGFMAARRSGILSMQTMRQNNKLQSRRRIICLCKGSVPTGKMSLQLRADPVPEMRNRGARSVGGSAGYA